MPGKPRIGFVGAGLMGLPMVQRLRSLGHAIRAYDIEAGRIAAAVAAGAAAAASPADAALDAGLVLLNLPTTGAVEQAAFGEAGVAGGLRKPQLVIDFSTIQVDKCKAFARKLRDYAPLGYSRQLLKDLEMAHEWSAGLKAPTPMMGEALSLYRILVHLGHAELDTGAILKVYDRGAP